MVNSRLSGPTKNRNGVDIARLEQCLISSIHRYRARCVSRKSTHVIFDMPSILNFGSRMSNAPKPDVFLPKEFLWKRKFDGSRFENLEMLV